MWTTVWLDPSKILMTISRNRNVFSSTLMYSLTLNVLCSKNATHIHSNTEKDTSGQNPSVNLVHKRKIGAF